MTPTPNRPDEREAAMRGAIARGWCHDKNAAKEMDADLADAIFREVLALLRRDAPREGASVDFEEAWRCRSASDPTERMDAYVWFRAGYRNALTESTPASKGREP